MQSRKSLKGRWYRFAFIKVTHVSRYVVVVVVVAVVVVVLVVSLPETLVLLHALLAHLATRLPR